MCLSAYRTFTFFSVPNVSTHCTRHRGNFISQWGAEISLWIVTRQPFFLIFTRSKKFNKDVALTFCTSIITADNTRSDLFQTVRLIYFVFPKS